MVLQTGHDSIFAGHLSCTKTLARIQAQFFWPRMVSGVRKHVRSCHICQKMAEKGSFPKCQIQSLYLSSRPFEKICLDIVGELHPASARGHIFILTLVDTW